MTRQWIAEDAGKKAVMRAKKAPTVLALQT